MITNKFLVFQFFFPQIELIYYFLFRYLANNTQLILKRWKYHFIAPCDKQKHKHKSFPLWHSRLFRWYCNFNSAQKSGVKTWTSFIYFCQEEEEEEVPVTDLFILIHILLSLSRCKKRLLQHKSGTCYKTPSTSFVKLNSFCFLLRKIIFHIYREKLPLKHIMTFPFFKKIL